MELLAVGHADYAPRGRDIVCAGVSALLYGFLSYIRGLPPIATEGEAPYLQVEEGEGSLWVRTHGLDERDVLGWYVTEAGLLSIASAYPACVAVDSGDLSPKERSKHESI